MPGRRGTLHTGWLGFVAGFAAPRDIDRLAFRTVARRPVSADGHATNKDTCSLSSAGCSRCLSRGPPASGTADWPCQRPIRQLYSFPDKAALTTAKVSRNAHPQRDP